MVLSGPQSKSRPIDAPEHSVSCSQSGRNRENLMREAEKMRFTIRMVEFIGITYTPYKVLRNQMTNMQEGDLFSRKRLVKSLKNMSKLRNEIYPVRLSDVVLQLNRSEQMVDMLICFKPKRR